MATSLPPPGPQACPCPRVLFSLCLLASLLPYLVALTSVPYRQAASAGASVLEADGAEAAAAAAAQEATAQEQEAKAQEEAAAEASRLAAEEESTRAAADAEAEAEALRCGSFGFSFCGRSVVLNSSWFCS